MGRRPRIVSGGTTISDGVIASTQGLFETSSADTNLFPLLLSLLLSRMLLPSPLTAGCLLRPDELDPEFDSCAAELDAILIAEVSITSPLFGDLAPRTSSSTQPAGVGGTGPNEETKLAGGLLVGGETI